MKRFLIVLIALLTMVAFVTAADVSAAAKSQKATGAVTAYEAGNSITVKGAKADMTFAVTGDTEVKGEVAVDAKVTVTYTKAADGTMTATAIQVTPAKKKK